MGQSVLLSQVTDTTSTPIDTIIPLLDTLPDSISVDTTFNQELNGRTLPGLDGTDLPQSLGSEDLDPRNGGRGNLGSDPSQQGPGSSVNQDAVLYGDKDSSWTDLINKEIHLYGDAFVKYDGFEVKADYIIFDLLNNEIMATARPGVAIRPEFINGEQTVKADSLRFNINTQTGLVHGARILQQNLYVHGATTKFIRAGQDSLHIDDVIYNRNALITSCSHDHPHWGIRTTKLKMIPEKVAVIGPMDIELAGIPTPLAFPFAFAPLFSFNQASSGLLAPDQWLRIDGDLGVGIVNLGYHFAISDRLNLTLRGDLYTRGSWGIKALSQYRKRYKYNGSVNFNFARQLLESATSETPFSQESWAINLTHTQDAKAHPFRTIGGTLRFSVNNYAQRNLTDARSQLNNQINSNFNFTQKINSKLNLTASITHSQNSSTNLISFTLPRLQLRMSRIYPFKKSNSSSNNEKWFEKINVQYNGGFRNSVETLDSILFTKQTLESFRAGFTHELDLASSYKVLDYFSFNTSISYDEFWYLNTYEPIAVGEDGRVSQDTVTSGFTPLREMSVSAGLSTNIFGTIQFKKGWLRGLRHTMRPNISLSYRPGTDGYFEFFDIDENSLLDEPFIYNPFTPSTNSSGTRQKLFQNESLSQGGMSVNYSLDNVIEGKYFSKKDSTEKKFKIFDRINLNGNYNFQSDSLKWSQVSISGNASLFNKKTTLQIQGRLDPYMRADTTSNGFRGARINQSANGLLRLDEMTLTLSTTFTLKEVRDWFAGKEEETTRGRRNSNNSPSQRDYDPSVNFNPDDGPDDFDPDDIRRGRNSLVNQQGNPRDQGVELFSWFEDFRIQHIFRAGIEDNGSSKEFETSAHTIQITTGNIPLSDNWSMRIGNISYDLKRGEWVYPSFNLTRKLHCWDMRFGWQPQRDTYTFFIGVSAAPFSDFLKYNRGQDTFTSFGNRF